MRVLLACAALLCLSVPVSVAQGPAGADPASAVAPDAAAAEGGEGAAETGNPAEQAGANERICRTAPRAESRLRRQRICHTRAEWDLIEHEASRAVRSAGSVQGRGDDSP